MVAKLQFIVVGSAAKEVVRDLHARQLRSDLFEVELDYEDPRAKRLFDVEENDSSKNWLITWWELRRYYSAEELESSKLYHLSVRRVFPEAIIWDWADRNDFESEIDATGCRILRRQIGLVVLERALRCKDALVCLSDGTWACKPEFASRLYQSNLEKPPITPIFTSKSKMKRWTSERRTQSGVLDTPLSEYYISEGEFGGFDWLQLHFKVGSISISELTQIGTRPYRASLAPDTICIAKEVYGPGTMSELYLRQTGSLQGDWVLTNEFVGWGGANSVYPPRRELVVSRNAYRFLTKERLHNIDLDRAHLVDR